MPLSLISQENFFNRAKIRALKINSLQWKFQLRVRVKVRRPLPQLCFLIGEQLNPLGNPR
jgi:hypothetical protein